MYLRHVNESLNQNYQKGVSGTQSRFLKTKRLTVMNRSRFLVIKSRFNPSPDSVSDPDSAPYRCLKQDDSIFYR